MSEAAECSFCSRRDPSVTVICEGRCLMCHRCHCSGSIRKLLMDACEPSIDVTGAEMEPDCPLCELPFVPPMLVTIKGYRREQNSVRGEQKVSHLSLATAPVTLMDLIQKLLGENKDCVSDQQMNLDGVDVAKPGFPMIAVNGQRDETPPAVNPMSGLSNGIGVTTIGTNDEDAERVTIAELTPQTTLSLFSDVVVEMWEDFRQNRLEPITVCTVKQINKRKTTVTNKEYRLRNLLDILHRPSWELEGKVDPPIQASTNAALFLFGKLMGMKPKAQAVVRPVHGVLFTTLIVMMTNESCLKHQTLLSSDNEPTKEDVRNKLGKFAFKPIPVRRLISALKGLFACDEAHWSVTPLKAICTEANIPLPWSDAAISRLLHTVLSVSAFPDVVKDKLEEKRYEFTTQSAQVQRAKVALEMRTAALHQMKHLDRRVSLLFQRLNGDTSVAPNPSALQHAQGGAAAATHLSSDSRGRSDSRSAVNGSRPASPSRSGGSSVQGAQKHRRLAGIGGNHSYSGDFDEMLTWQTAFDKIGAVTCDIFVLAAIALEAWEHEVNDVVKLISKSVIRGQRRGALAGYYDVSTGNMNVAEKTCMRRLVMHYMNVNRERVSQEREDARLKLERDKHQAQLDEEAKRKADAKEARRMARESKAPASLGKGIEGKGEAGGAKIGLMSSPDGAKSGNKGKRSKGGSKGGGVNTTELSEEELAARLAEEAAQALKKEQEETADREYSERIRERREKEDAAWMKDKEDQVWVDWSECRDIAARRAFTFSVPDSLMKKSDAELVSHFEDVLKDVRFRERTEGMDVWPEYGLLDFDYFPLFGYPDGLVLYKDETNTSPALVANYNASGGVPSGSEEDTDSHAPPITRTAATQGEDMSRPVIDDSILDDVNRNENRFSRISTRLRTSLPVLPYPLPRDKELTKSMTEMDKPLRVLSVVERHLLSKSMSEKDLTSVSGSVLGLKSLRATPNISATPIQHRTPAEEHLVSASSHYQAPRAPPGSYEGPSQGQHKLSFVDLLGPSNMPPQDVLMKTGLIPEMKSDDCWDENQFDSHMQRMEALRSRRADLTTTGRAATVADIETGLVNSALRDGSGGIGGGDDESSLHKAESAPVLRGMRREAQIGPSLLNLEDRPHLSLAHHVPLHERLGKSSSAEVLLVPFDSDVANDLDVDYQDYPEELLDALNVSRGHDVEAAAQQRAVKRLTRGLRWNGDEEDMASSVMDGLEEVSLELNMKSLTDPFVQNTMYTSELDGSLAGSLDASESLLTNSADGGSLIERALAPVGSQSRAKLDLSHFTRLRPSELPQMGGEGVQILSLRDARLGSSPQGTKQLCDIMTQLCKDSRASMLRSLDIGGNGLGYSASRALANAIVQHTLGGGGLPDLQVLLAPDNDMKDLGAESLLNAVSGSPGHGGRSPSLVKLDLRSNSLLMTESLSSILSRFQQLRVLDLSWNGITLVSPKQIDALKASVVSLVNLNVFSLAYNRIQDKGATVVIDTLRDHCAQLRVLDLSHCFLSNQSLPSLVALLSQPAERPLEVTLLFGIVLNREEKDELTKAAEPTGRRVVRTGHHTGIELIEDYFYKPSKDDFMHGPASGEHVGNKQADWGSEVPSVIVRDDSSSVS